MKFTKRAKASLLASLLFGDVSSCSNSVKNDSRLISAVSKNSPIPPLPGDLMSWCSIRKKKLAHVDKTAYLYYFLEKIEFFCYLTRPRRFGKTTYLDMMDNFFRGCKNGIEFKETEIFKYGNTDKRDGTWVEHPVIRIDLSNIHRKRSFEDQLHAILVDIANEYTIPFDQHSTISNLIRRLYDKKKQLVVVLVDEYDVLLNDCIYSDVKDASLLSEVKEDLNTLFRQIKASYRYIKVAMLVGVNRYSLAQLSSGPNCYVDLTYDPEFSKAFGFTKTEILASFDPHIKDFATKKSKHYNEVMNGLEDWYDGYVFSKEDTSVKIFNPISVIKSLSNCVFQSYWSSTGSVKSIVKLLYNDGKNLENVVKDITIDKNKLDTTYDPNFNSISTEILMLNTGYLTISEILGDEVKLNFPNKEVKEYLMRHYYTYIPSWDGFFEQFSLHTELKRNLNDFKISEIVENLNIICFPEYKNVLTSAPYEYEVNRRMVHAFNISQIAYDNPQINEDKQTKSKKKKILETKGDLDLVTTSLKTNYVIELKRGALKDGVIQIMRYFKCSYKKLKEFTGDKAEMYLLVLNFDPKLKNTKFTDWVAIPCKNQTMEIEKLVASSDNVAAITKECYHHNLALHCKTRGKGGNGRTTDPFSYLDHV